MGGKRERVRRSKEEGIKEGGRGKRGGGRREGRVKGGISECG